MNNLRYFLAGAPAGILLGLIAAGLEYLGLSPAYTLIPAAVIVPPRLYKILRRQQ